MSYLLFKAGHILAVLVWLSGMLSVAILLAALRTTDGPFLLPEERLLQAVRNWQRRVTAPAMVAVWLLGLTLAGHGHWFAAGWLSAKFGLVLVLSVLHGLLALALRRVAVREVRKPGASLRFAPSGLLLTAAAIVTLVVLKPF